MNLKVEITNLSRIDIDINIYQFVWSGMVQNYCGNVGMDMEQQKQNSSSYSAQQLSYDGAYSRPKASLFQIGVFN